MKAKKTIKKAIKKAAPKKAAKKAAPKKAAKKAAPKKVVKKAAPKKVVKKAAPKKAAPKKATKKAAPKKVIKKAAPKKGKKSLKKVAAKIRKSSKKIVTTTTVVTTTTTVTTPNPKETHYLLILDESGSMQGVKTQTLNGLNEQIKTIKNLEAKYPDQEYFVSIIKFDDEIVPLFENIPASDLRELTEEDYKPDALTALYDAIGFSVTKLNSKIKDKVSSGEASALVVILTDGDENASKEYKEKGPDPARKVRELISELEKGGMWTFTFIGANQDSILTAKSFGINANNAVNYTASLTGSTLAFSSINSALSKRAAYTSAGVYAATTDGFLSSVTRGLSDIGEDSSLLDLTGSVSAEDIQKAKDSLKSKNS